MMIWMPSTLSMNTCAVFSLSPVRLLHPVAVGILQLLHPLLAQMTLLQLRLPLLHALSFVMPSASSFTSAWAFFSEGSAIRFPGPFSPRDTSSDRSHDRGISEDRSRKRFASGDRSGHRRRFASGDSPSPKRRRSSRASSGDDYFEGPPSRSSPAPPSSPSREDRDPDDPSISAPVRAMVDFILQTFPESQASPSHPSSRSFDLSATAGVAEVVIPPGSLLSWSHALSDFSRRRRSDSPVVLRMGRLATRFCLLSTSLKGYRIHPLREWNLRRIPTFSTYFGTRFPIVAMFPCHLKKLLL